MRGHRAPLVEAGLVDRFSDCSVPEVFYTVLSVRETGSDRNVGDVLSKQPAGTARNCGLLCIREEMLDQSAMLSYMSDSGNFSYLSPQIASKMMNPGLPVAHLCNGASEHARN